MKKKRTSKSVETIRHGESSRKNIPTAEYQSLMNKEDQNPVRVAYERRNRDLDPQLVWRGKDEQDWSDLIVQASPLYIQEKVHPKVLIDDLIHQTKKDEDEEDRQFDLFGDFNGLPDDNAKTEFYQHDANWANRLILGDSLQVMASLAEREGLRGKVQSIFIDPPYGIKFNSNFQWSTTDRDVKDGKTDHITREPEQVKAFRDTWRDGIHSYLTYLRDRLTVARDLLTESGSIFVQIGDENVHRVRAVMDEVFGEENCCAVIAFRKTGGQSAKTLSCVADYVIWYAKKYDQLKYRQPYRDKTGEDRPSIYRMVQDKRTGIRRKINKEEKETNSIDETLEIFAPDTLVSLGASAKGSLPFSFEGVEYNPGNNQHWKTTFVGLKRLAKANRLINVSTSLYYLRKLLDFPVAPMDNLWQDTSAGGYSDDKIYVVQTNRKIIQRCILMSTDPGDLCLDPTCGSGTTATVAEQWGRRWITIDTSRVALALARSRIMGARYPYYLLADSSEGQRKEAEISRTEPSHNATFGNIRQGFVYERVPHITLKSIATNAEIDVIWEKIQEKLEPLCEQINSLLRKQWKEWEIPSKADKLWSDEAIQLHGKWWNQRIARQKEIDASIAAKADHEYLYDKPYEDKKKVRVAGPFTVESLSPHRMLVMNENDELINGVAEPEERDFTQMILENLKTAGVQQAHKEDKINFTSLTPWPGEFICAEGRYMEGEKEKRAAILIGPEFGSLQRIDLVEAAKETGDAGFDVLISCAFNYDGHSSDLEKLGRIQILKARMNADLHMADDLKNTGKGNLFVIFGEPDIDINEVEDDKIQVKINGVDVFHPQTGEVRSDGADGIACWFIDTDYNEESFFVRH
ncbi:MAG: site-specific DNA-methyltransferase, partial [Balneolales bacterium]